MPHSICDNTMKRRLSLALASLVACIAVSAFGLSGDLAGNVDALDDLNALSTKFDEAVREQDAAALAALFAPDGVRVSPDGVFSGREAIEKSFSDDFQRVTDNLVCFSDRSTALNREGSVVRWPMVEDTPGREQTRI